MKTKTIISLLVIVAIGIWVVFLVNQKPRVVTATPIKIGFILPITGDAATYGESAKKAADLAIKDLKNDTDISIEPIYEDSQLKGSIAASAASKLINIDKVAAVVTFSSGETLSVCPITTSGKIVLLTSASSPAVSDCGGYTFRNYPSDIYQGKVLAAKATELGYKKVVVSYINNDYGNGLKNELLKNYTNSPIVEAHKPGDKDFRTLVTKIKAEQADAVILIFQLTEGSQIITQMEAQGLRIPILGSEALKDDSLMSKIPEPMKPYLTVISAAQYNGSEAAEFKEDYKSAYGQDPAAFADYVYDNVIILGEAIKNCKTPDSTCINNRLRKTKTVGVTGNISFDERGDVKEKEYDVFVIEGNIFRKK